MITVAKIGSPSGLIILGLIFFIFGALMTYQNIKESRYQATSGVVKTSEIKKMVDTQPGSKTSSVIWVLLVNYEYSVDGQLYKSDNIASELPMSDAVRDKPPSKKLLRLAERFKPGATVKVYASLKRPGKSMLLHTPNYGVWLIMTGLALFAGAAYWLTSTL